MTHGTPLDRDLDTLMASAAVGLASVSTRSVKAVHAAHGAASPNLAAFAAAHAAELDGDRLDLTGSVVDGSPSRDAHASLAVALFAGSGELAHLVPELVAHARMGEAEMAIGLLGQVFAAVRRSRDAGARGQLADEFRRMPADDPIKSWFGMQLFRLHVVAGDPPEVIEDVGWDVLQRCETAGDRAGASYIAIELLMYLPYDRSSRARAKLLEDDPDGWGLSLLAHEQERVAGRQRQFDMSLLRMVRTALEQSSNSLMSHALTALSYRSSERDVDRAAALARRGIAHARRTELWAPLVGAHIMLTWVLVEDLQLAAAHDQARTLVQLVEDEGLTTFIGLATLLELRVQTMAGALHGADELVRVRVPAPGDSSLRVTRVAVAQAELLSAVGSSHAEPTWRKARELMRESGESGAMTSHEQMMMVALIDARIDPAGRAWERFPQLVEDDDVASVADAISWLARHIVLDGASGARAVLEQTVAATSYGRRKILDLALDEAHAVLDDDWMRLDDVRTRWAEAGFVRDAALVAASVGCLAAASNAGVEAGKRFDVAHHSLAGLGLSADVRRVRAARTRSSIVSEPTAAAEPSSILEFFDGDPQARARVVDLFVQRVIPRGERLPADCACTITSGIATLDFGDPEIPVELVTAPAPVHLERVVGLDTTSRDMLAVAVTPCAIDAIPVSALAVELTRSPSASNAYMTWLVTRSRRELQRARSLVAQPVEARVASVLLDIADGLGSRDDHDWGNIPISRTVLGSLAGTTRESVSRTISHMVRNDVVAADRATITILDRAACEALAGRGG